MGASRTSFLMHPDDINADAYMIVGQLNAEDFRKANGKFRFKLVYENIDSSHNQNPVFEPTSTVTWEQSSWLTADGNDLSGGGGGFPEGFECVDPQDCDRNGG